MNTVQEAVRKFWRKQRLASGRVVVGFSGGADSTALLHALVVLADELGVQPFAAHLHHGQRAEEADADAEHCARMAARLGVPFQVRQVSVTAFSEERRLNLEEAGRIARYQFLEDVKENTKARYIATGHTLDDHAETVIMHLMRGSGARGLRGIPAVRGHIIRPLLWVTRSDTAAYCKEHSLPTVLDRTNLDLCRERARLREGLPAISGWPREAVYRSVARSAEIISAEDELLSSLAEEQYRHLRIPMPEWLEAIASPPLGTELDVERLCKLPTALGRRVLRHAIESLSPQHQAGFEFVEAVLSAARTQTKGGFDVPGSSLTIRLEPGRLILYPKMAAEKYRFALEEGHSAPLPFLGAVLCVVRQEPPLRPVRPWPNSVCLDMRCLRGERYVAPYAPGEYRPIGGPGARPIKDLLREAGVPSWLRKHVPVVYDAEGPLWALGCRPAERVAATPKSSVWLLVSCLPLGSAV